MAKKLHVFKGGAVYVVKGVGGKERKLVFLNEVKILGREVLMFRPVKAIQKHKAKQK